MASITILGRIGKDVEVKQVGSSALAKFPIVEDVGFGDKKVSIWYDINIWGKQAESKLTDYLKKGQQVQVSGEFSQREYEGKKYNEVRVWDIKLAGSRAEESAGVAKPQQQGYEQKPTPLSGGGTSSLDDDLPFAQVDWRLG